MKYCIFCIAFSLMLACNGQKIEGDSELPSLKITMDTVVIDPGQEILYLNLGFELSALSENNKYLYNLNPRKNTIEQMNLNTLSFEKKYIFENEGPNGVGAYILGFSLINDEKLLFSTSQKVAVFNWQAEKLESFNIIELGKELNQLEEGDWPFKTVSISPKGNQFGSLIFNYEKKTNAFVLINRDKGTFKKLPVPGIEKAKKFGISFKVNGGGSGAGALRYLKKTGSKILLGTSSSSEIYVLDNGSDTLRHLTFNSKLTPNEKSGTYPAEVGTLAELAKFRRKIQEDINFMLPAWDEKKQVYYRFSYQSIYEEDAELKEGQEFPQISGAKVFLSVLDKDFNLIVEGIASGLIRKPSFHFAKDGKLWLFENIEDEMGFVRLDITW